MVVIEMNTSKIERLLDFARTTCPRCLRTISAPQARTTFRDGLWLYHGFEQVCICGLERGYRVPFTLMEVIRYLWAALERGRAGCVR